LPFVDFLTKPYRLVTSCLKRKIILKWTGAVPPKEGNTRVL